MENGPVIYKCLQRLIQYEIVQIGYCTDRAYELEGINLNHVKRSIGRKSDMSEEDSDSVDSSMELDEEDDSEDGKEIVKYPD